MAILLKDFVKLLRGGIPHVRLISQPQFERLNKEHKAHWQRPDEAVLATFYLDSTPVCQEDLFKYQDCQVMHFDTVHEVSHKEYKEKGLLPPFRPDLTAEYEFTDIQQKTYYDIYINYEVKENFNV